MLRITRRITEGAADVLLVLPYQLRCKARLRTALDTGEEVGVMLERGCVLRDGDLLAAEDGRIVQIVAAREEVSTVRGASDADLIRAAYHLGNRHVALQIGRGWLRYQHDHVLDAMVRGLGFRVIIEQAPFEPEPGAYGARAHPLTPHAH